MASNVAKCENCGAACEILTTTKGKNEGKQYYKCPRRCPSFFMWVDHFKLCKCGGQCKVRRAKTVANDGRLFWCCPQSTGMDNRGCGMFEWIEQVPEIDSNQETGQCSQGPTTNMAIASRSSGYLKGYLSGVASGYRNATKMLDELVDAVEKLDLE